MYVDIGNCDVCGSPLIKVWFIATEYRKGIPTGRVRDAARHLECPHCWKKFCVDDTFNMPWRKS